MDLRVERTYASLTQGLLALLQEKTFDQITVGELCQKAMIRRTTFYKHFGDKYDLYSYVIRTLQEEFKAKTLPQIANQDAKSFFLTMFDLCIEFVEQNPYIIHGIIDSKHSQLLFDILSNEIEQDVIYHMEQHQEAIGDFPPHPDLIASMITGAMINTIKWWIPRQDQISREEIINLYSQISFSYLDQNT